MRRPHTVDPRKLLDIEFQRFLDQAPPGTIAELPQVCSCGSRHHVKEPLSGKGPLH